MSLGLTISELPGLDKNQIDGGDLFFIAEKVQDDVYRTRKLDASYLLRLQTEAINVSDDIDSFQILKDSTTNGITQATVFNFRGLKSGSNIQIEQSDTNITISSVVDGENTSDLDNNVGVFQEKDSTTGFLKFKSISGEKSIETRSDTNKIYVKPKNNHYMFIPVVDLNSSLDTNLVSIKSKKKDDLDALWPTRPLSGEWNTGSQTIDLTDILNLLPTNIRDSISLAEKGLALVNIKVSAYSGSSSIHYLDVLSSSNNMEWRNKIEIEPVEINSSFYESRESLSTIIEFDNTTNKFNWRIAVDSIPKTLDWYFSISMKLEGFYV